MTTFNQERIIRIATRASQLALWQANHIAEKIRELQQGLQVEIVHISTQGDRDTAAPLWQMGGLGVFTREVQKAVLDQSADLAVHSLKDLPTETAPGLLLAAVPPRANYFDVLVLPAGNNSPKTPGEPFAAIPYGAVVGTGSLRRRAQILHYRPDITFIEVRGNVDTRLKKLDQGECQALILAAAGLTRLDLSHRISLKLSPPWMYPAVGQGALGIECRNDDEELIQLLSQLNHRETRAAVTAERALLNSLRAGCHAPVGIQTAIKNETLLLEGIILAKDGSTTIFNRQQGTIAQAAETGKILAEELIKLGAGQLLQE